MRYSDQRQRKRHQKIRTRATITELTVSSFIKNVREFDRIPRYVADGPLPPAILYPPRLFCLGPFQKKKNTCIMKGLEKYKEKIQFIHGHPNEPHLDCDHWRHEILLSRVPCNATCDAIQLCENNSCCLLPVDIFSCRVMIRKKT